MSQLSPDAPLKDLEKDHFNVVPFAETLAKGLLKMFQPGGFVVALHGPWGSGKTTVLNFVRIFLDKNDISTEESKDPITIIDFNPWWFSGREDLTRQFFDTFGLGLSKRWKNAITLVKTVGAIADAVSPLGTPIITITNSLQDRKDPQRKSIQELKDIVNKKLDELGRVLVIIDDIDRLTSAEIRELFLVIKAIGDFNNVVYLLAFDRDVVNKALEDIQGDIPDDYLEKIIQASFDIPDPTEWHLYQFFMQEFPLLLIDDDKPLLEKERERKVIEQIVSVLDTPRKITRFLNAFRLSYPAVEGEVNPIDFAGIEAVRIFFPSLYHYIQKNEDFFVRSYPLNVSIKEKEEIEQIFSEMFSGSPQLLKDSMIDLIRLLFPAVNALLILEPRGLGTETERQHRKERRICTEEKFQIYFRWSIPEGGISSREFNSILDVSGDALSFGNKIRGLWKQKRLTGESRLDEFLYLLHANLDRIPPENIPSVLQAFANEGDTILPVIEKSDKYSWGWRNSNFVERIFIELLGEVNQSERLVLLTKILENGTALLQLSEIVSEIGRQHGWYKVNKLPKNERLLTEDQFTEFESVFVKRIQKAANEGALIKNIGLRHILSAWNAASPSSIESIRQWAENIVKDPQNLVKFIDGFYLPRVSADSSIIHIEYVLDFEFMRKLIDPFSLQETVQNLIESPEISDHQRDALEAFSRDLGDYRASNR